MNILLPGKKTFSFELLFKNNLLYLFSLLILLILLLCSMPLAAANQYLFPDEIISSSQQSFYGDEFVNSASYDINPYNSRPYNSKPYNYGFDNYGFDNYGFDNYGSDNYGFDNYGFDNHGPNNYSFEQQLPDQTYLNYPHRPNTNYESYDSIPVPPQRSSYPPTRQPVNNFNYASKPYLSKKPRYAIDEYLENQQNRTPENREQLPYQADRRSSLYNRSHSDVLYVSDLKPKLQKKIYYSREKHNKLKRYNSEQYSNVPSRSNGAEIYQKSREYNHYSPKQQLNPLEHIRYVPVVVYQMPAAFSDNTSGFGVPNNMLSGLNYPGSAFNYNRLNNSYALKNIHNLKKLNSINMRNLVNPVSSQYNPLSSMGVFPELNSKHPGRKILNGYEHSSEELPFNHFNDVLPHSPGTDSISRF